MLSEARRRALRGVLYHCGGTNTGPVRLSAESCFYSRTLSQVDLQAAMAGACSECWLLVAVEMQGGTPFDQGQQLLCVEYS
jgi:hypothetical protein